ncbi:PREDICTED: olfactory receptor 14J1-like, partial [Nestor notabilis]
PVCYLGVLFSFFGRLSCSHSYIREVGLLVISACLLFGCFVFIFWSYVQIFRAVLRIPSEQGRHKAFSTCLPHLVVVSVFISTGTFAYLKPPSVTSPSLDVVVPVLYALVPPAVNPLIYSLRNQELRDAVRKLLTGCVLAGMHRLLHPPSVTSPSLDVVVPVLYALVPPAVNPLIYSLRNQELRDA